MATVDMPARWLAETPAPDTLRARLGKLPAWRLTARQRCDLEMLGSGVFSPLDGFLNQADYDGVLANMRLANGALWPIPITLDVTAEFADSLPPDGEIVLLDADNTPLASMHVQSCWRPDKNREAEQVYGTRDRMHPAVSYLFEQAGAVYLGGAIQLLALPRHFDFTEYRDTPASLREKIRRVGWKQVVAFQTRNPMHRAHKEITERAAASVDGGLIIQPVVGMTKPGDVDHYTRVRCYQHIIKHYPAGKAMLSLLPLAMRMGGPREALWHAIIRKNYGFTHFIVGRDHAGPGNDSTGKPFYGPYDAQKLLGEYQNEIGITMLPFEAVSYVKERNAYLPANEVRETDTVLTISGTQFRQMLFAGNDVPAWFSYPEIIQELRKTHPPKHQQGFTVFFTGLSGSGKSTLANALLAKLMESGDRKVTLLDGDQVRQMLSSELGFSREHRDLNILRIGYVASEITRHGGIAICAPIAPYAATRQKVRKMVEQYGAFIEIHVATPLEVCEQRDTKGLYAKARQGILKEFTGISDPYEAPESPEVRLDTQSAVPDELVSGILDKLKLFGIIKLNKVR